MAAEVRVRWRFKSTRLEALYTDAKGAQKYPTQVVDAFFDAVAVIDAALDERDLYQLKGFHFEKLKGKRQHQRSLRLGGQWRLILELKHDAEGKLILVVDIENYHD